MDRPSAATVAPVAQEQATTVHLRNYKKDGTPFWNEVHIAPVRDPGGELVRYVGVQVDVSAYRDPAQRSFLANVIPAPPVSALPIDP